MEDGMKFMWKGDIRPVFDSSWPIDHQIYKSFSDCGIYDYAMEMTTRELNQAVEGMYHNLNTLQSRSGNQLPFSSINYGTCTSWRKNGN